MSRSREDQDLFLPADEDLEPRDDHAAKLMGGRNQEQNDKRSQP